MTDAERRTGFLDGPALKIGTVLVAAILFLVTVRGFGHFFDLGVYRGAVRYWLHDGGNLYTYRYAGSEFGFTYPPFAALVLGPLAVLPWSVVVVAAVLANIGAVIVLLRWFLVPVLRRQRWPVLVGCAVVFCALLVFEPVRTTFRLGQINLLLLVLVCFDHRKLRGTRWAGVGIGIAAAIKLIPAVFIGYLLITRQYRAALVATGTAAAVTALTWVIAPGPSRTFWTDALWDTGRVGQLTAGSNQSLRGAVARFDLGSAWWLAAVAVVLVIWYVRVRRAATAGDYTAAFALTGVLGCLISPVTWIHHLVWLLPALFVLLDAALTEPDPRRRRIRTAVAAVLFLLLCFRLSWAGPASADLYVWVSLALLVATPLRSAAPPRETPPPDRPAASNAGASADGPGTPPRTSG